MESILLNRLTENATIDFENGFCWDGSYVTLEDINQAIKTGDNGVNEPYGDTWEHPAKMRDKNYHIKRVIYFIKHPEEIVGIELDNACNDMYILPYTVVIDGWHRLLAARYLNLDKISAIYGGRMDVLDYLTGRVIDAPLE